MKIVLKHSIIETSEDAVLLTANPNITNPAAYDTAQILTPANRRQLNYPPHLILVQQSEMTAHNMDMKWWAEMIRSQIGDALGDPARVGVFPILSRGHETDPRVKWYLV